MISVENLKKKFGTLEVLKGISLEVNKGEIVSIVGPSGAGKTTLLHILGTLSRPDEGLLTVNGTDIKSLSERKLAAFRNQNIGFVFQFHHLLPEFTALENVCIPAFINNRSRKEAEKKAEELLTILNVAHRLQHKPSELSGGEQQRVAVARALINNPDYLLADEPSGNLDSKNKEELHKLFFDIREKFSTTFVIVTHDDSLAQMSDRIIRLLDGIVCTEQQLK